MMYGELKEKSKDYQLGHETGSVRAYDDAIAWFEKVKFGEQKGKKYSTDEIIAFLEACKENWLEHCRSYGMAESEADEP